MFDDRFDLNAHDIQRARDHGIPGYTEYRETCQAGKINDFKDFEVFMQLEVRISIHKFIV